MTIRSGRRWYYVLNYASSTAYILRASSPELARMMINPEKISHSLILASSARHCDLFTEVSRATLDRIYGVRNTVRL